MSEQIKSATNEEQALKDKLNSETSKISWLELQKFYASGSVIVVTPELDLINVACQFSEDNKEIVGAWLEQEQVFKMTDQTAQEWFDNKATVWASVVAPWVLVQKVVTEQH